MSFMNIVKKTGLWYNLIAERGTCMYFDLKGEWITLQQLLKVCDVISSGGQIKEFLADNEIYVNDQRETRRGRKIHRGDVVSFYDTRIIVR